MTNEIKHLQDLQDLQIVVGTGLSFAQLVNATENRINFNIDMAAEALVRGDISECQRFQNNANMMLEDIKFARMDNDGTYLSGNRGWETI